MDANIIIIRKFNIRTGWHAHPVREMPDGTRRAVWQEYDGPEGPLFYTAVSDDDTAKETTYADYLAYMGK